MIHCYSPQDLSGMAGKINGIPTKLCYLPIFEAFLCFSSFPFLTWRRHTPVLISHREKGIKPYVITVLKPWRNSKIHASFPIWKSWTKIFLRCLSVSDSNPELKGTFYILWHVFLVRKETFQVPPSRLRKQMQSCFFWHGVTEFRSPGWCLHCCAAEGYLDPKWEAKQPFTLCFNQLSPY